MGCRIIIGQKDPSQRAEFSLQRNRMKLVIRFNILIKNPSKCLARETGFETASKIYQKTAEQC